MSEPIREPNAATGLHFLAECYVMAGLGNLPADLSVLEWHRTNVEFLRRSVASLTAEERRFLGMILLGTLWTWPTYDELLVMAAEIMRVTNAMTDRVTAGMVPHDVGEPAET